MALWILSGLLAFFWIAYGWITLMLELVNGLSLTKSQKIIAIIYFAMLGPFAKPILNLILGALEK